MSCLFAAVISVDVTHSVCLTVSLLGKRVNDVMPIVSLLRDYEYCILLLQAFIQLTRLDLTDKSGVMKICLVLFGSLYPCAQTWVVC